MLIHDLSHLEILSQSRSIYGGQTSAQDAAALTLSVGEDKTLSLFQGKNKLFSTILPVKPTDIKLSITGNIPSVAISSSAWSINGKSGSALVLTFANPPVGFARPIPQ